jgi:phage baseplate assembly protein W
MAIYSDIDIELTQQRDGDVQRDTEDEAIRNSLTNIVNTMQGSRRMLPEFALNIAGLLFEPMDDSTAYEIGSRLLGAIETWDDRIIVQNINVHSEVDKAYYKITLDFTTKTSQTVQTVEYILKQG